MYSIDVTKDFKKQFKTLERRAGNGRLNEKDISFLKKYSHCIMNLINNPFYSGLNTSPFNPLSKILSKIVKEKIICYHSYLENHTSSAKRIYWYFTDNTTIRILGIAKHPKENSNELPRFKDLSEEDFV